MGLAVDKSGFDCSQHLALSREGKQTVSLLITEPFIPVMFGVQHNLGIRWHDPIKTGNIVIRYLSAS